MVPAGVRAEVEAALAAGGHADAIARDLPVGGGCISPAARIEAVSGDRWFLKWAGAGETPPDFFTSQAEGLRALEGAGTVRVPRVIAAAECWLLLEWLDGGPARGSTWSRLGEGLAALHRVRGVRFGWPADNYIGSLPQPNVQGDSWPAFWTERRIGPQWEVAREAGFFAPADDRAFARLLDAVHVLLAPGDADGPSLLHGDLWGGNVHVTTGGDAALIDPSVYHGHREVDLAMAELFGGFDRAFFAAYREAWPLRPGYEEERRALYQLYYLLVHVNLFGGSYVDSVRRVLRPYAD
jgi:fructosamine-3-kinase